LVAVVSVVVERIVTARSPERVVIDDGVGAGSSPAGENNDRGEDRACHGIYSFEQSLPSLSRAPGEPGFKRQRRLQIRHGYKRRENIRSLLQRDGSQDLILRSVAVGPRRLQRVSKDGCRHDWRTPSARPSFETAARKRVRPLRMRAGGCGTKDVCMP